MKYIVKLEYFRFVFDDAVSACTFAEIAKKNYTTDKNKDDFEVSIYLIEENKED